MEYQEALEILQKMLDKHSLDDKDKEAISTAIGLLSWGVLAKAKVKRLKARRDKSTQW